MKIDCTGYVINPTDNEKTNLLINIISWDSREFVNMVRSYFIDRSFPQNLCKKSLDYFGKLVFKYLEEKDYYLLEEYSRYELKMSCIA